MQACTLMILLLGFSKALDSDNYPIVKTNETEMYQTCIRPCVNKPQTCHYRLQVERYYVFGGACGSCGNRDRGSHCYRDVCITANGYKKGFLSINRKLPSPALQVCKGDRLIVDVDNRITDESITIHWNGLLQKGYQYYDGVPFVTQCPILPGTTFRYNFVANQAGTFSYYSHSGLQKVDGIGGALIVRDVSDSQSNLYDYDLPDHVLYISDWFYKPAVEYMPGFHNKTLRIVPNTYLINGRGVHYLGRRTKSILPLSQFNVVRGKKYRFRLIGGHSTSCGAAVMIEEHKLLVISADGNFKFDPILVDTVNINSGERFDVVFDANKSTNKYNIFVESVDEERCAFTRNVAILKYSEFPKDVDLRLPPPVRAESFGTEFNAIASSCSSKKSNKICISHLKGENDAPALDGHCFSTLSVGFGYYNYEDAFLPATYQLYTEPLVNSIVRPTASNITYKSAPSNILTQFNEIPRHLICTDDRCQKPNRTKPCHCTHIFHFAHEIMVNMVLYDKGGLNKSMYHPIHLHGYSFYVLDQGDLPANPSDKEKKVRELEDQLRSDQINLKNRPQKDTITIPPNGYTLIRFYTDNPGAWLLSSNFIYDGEAGMAFVIRIGDASILPPVPENFPRCGNFVPD